MSDEKKETGSIEICRLAQELAKKRFRNEMNDIVLRWRRGRQSLRGGGTTDSSKNVAELDWSAIMSKTEIRTRLKLKERAFKTFIGKLKHPLKNHGRQQWQICLNDLDKNQRYRIEHGHDPR